MVLAVTDASVVAKWYLEEADSEAARRLRDDFFEGALGLRVPALLPFEVLNALRFHPAFTRRDLREAGRAFDQAGLPMVPLEGEFLARTVELSAYENLTVYDAAYLALAEIEGCPLYTADERILSARRGDASVVHIRDYPTSP